jgi:RNA polymerase sigma factor (sigma-70 family)
MGCGVLATPESGAWHGRRSNVGQACLPLGVDVPAAGVGHVMAATSPGEPDRRWRQDEEVGAFFAEHRRGLRGLLLANGCREIDADDIVQDSILVVRERWDRVRCLEKPIAYWYKTAIRMLWRRRREGHGRLATGDDAREYLMGLADLGDATQSVDQQEVLMALLRELPPGQLRVVWLRLVADLSEAETARILLVSRGTVKSQLHEAKSRLRELARKYDLGWDGEEG